MLIAMPGEITETGKMMQTLNLHTVSTAKNGNVKSIASS
jgi:hypothetical protein